MSAGPIAFELSSSKQLLEKTTALEAQQRRIERMNRTLATLSAINALIVRADDSQALLEEACRIAVEKGGFRLAAVGLADRNRRLHSMRFPFRD